MEVRSHKRSISLMLMILLSPAVLLVDAGAKEAGDNRELQQVCYSGRFYTHARTFDIDSANGKAAAAGWEEQNYEVEDAGTGGFAVATMWVVSHQGSGGTQYFNELGFGRQLTGTDSYGNPYTGNHFYRAANNAGGYFDRLLTKSPSGAHTWHIYMLEYSGGVWRAFIDGTNYGGWSNPNDAWWIDIGNEVSNSCTVINTTYFGSSNLSSPRPFRYQTSGGSWTTWGSGIEYEDADYESQWLSYAIYRRGWGP